VWSDGPIASSDFLISTGKWRCFPETDLAHFLT